jgi:hypothetical protein
MLPGGRHRHDSCYAPHSRLGDFRTVQRQERPGCVSVSLFDVPVAAASPGRLTMVNQIGPYFEAGEYFLSVDYQSSGLWKKTLERREDDQNAHSRDLLRSAYLQFRETVAPLAGEIAISMPMFTDHSIDHIDALWDTASLIVGDDFPLNPAEAFVLGGAFLLHDLGMGLAAFPAGLDSVKQDVLFGDVKISLMKTSGMKGPDAEDAAVVQVLRLRHAKQAERLVTQEFHVDTTRFYLLQDAALRTAYGPMIGRIAHSHWFDVAQLPNEFGILMGALPSFPAEWTVDPFKIACILRLADAAQIDSRRAPLYQRSFRNPTGVSADHWRFQQKLTRPQRIDDRLVFTATSSFSPEESASWWLAYETIRMISDELRTVDAACADLGKTRFPVRSIAGADDPIRFAQFLKTDGWVPLDASLKVGNVKRVVEHLGGSALYGDSPITGLRELISNAADASRARQVQFGGPDLSVEVSLIKDGEDWILTVRDKGLGMTAEQMVANLTDFGTSNWISNERLEEYPGLLASGYRATGRFGIGFYACFMLADKVEVRSLKFRKGSEETSVLVFEDGVRVRPLLRTAREDEQIDLGGTEVRILLKEEPFSEDGLLGLDRGNGKKDEIGALVDQLRKLCPLLDIDLNLSSSSQDTIGVVRGGEWKTAKPAELFDLLYPITDENQDIVAYDRIKESFISNVEDLIDDNGDIVGRASLRESFIGTNDGVGSGWSNLPRSAYVHIGGMRADSIPNTLGAFAGEPLKADRNSAFPIASPSKLTEWAESQGQRIFKRGTAATSSLYDANQTILGLGGEVQDLVCAYSQAGPITVRSLSTWVLDKLDVIVIDTDDVFVFHNENGTTNFFDLSKGQFFDLPPNVLVTDIYTQWLLPDEVASAPKNELFLKAIDWEIEGWDPAWWWYSAGRSNPFHQILVAASSAWEMDYVEIGLSLENLGRNRQEQDNRIILTSHQDVEVKMSAMRISKPRQA